MRNVRRLLPPLLAVVALAAFAAPASAESWTQEGKAIEKVETVELDGTTSFSALGTGYECAVEGEMELWPGATGEVSQFAIGPCETFGMWADCEVESAAADVPWSTELSGEDVTINDFSYTVQFDSGCQNEAWQVTAVEGITATPDNSAKISELDLSGSVSAGEPGGSPVPTTLEDTLDVSPAGVFGIGEGTVDTNLSGDRQVNILGSGTDCEADITIATPGTGTGYITRFDVDTSTCSTSGEFESCELVGSESVDLPWSGSVTAEGFTAKDVTIDETYDAGCSVGSNYDVTVPELSVTEDSESGSVSILGEGTVEIEEFFELPLELVGEFS